MSCHFGQACAGFLHMVLIILIHKFLLTGQYFAYMLEYIVILL